MKRFLANYVLITAGVSVVVTGVIFSQSVLTQQPPSNSPSLQRLERARKYSSLFKRRSLTNASPQEVGEAALNYTLANSDKFTVLSGTPQVVLIRPIKVADFSSWGFGELGFTGNAPPMMLVVVKGDFDTTNFIRSVSAHQLTPIQRTKFQYIAYIFDLSVGLPTLTTTVLTGENFRRELNDPSLPDIN
jgi:hypothetical protein